MIDLHCHVLPGIDDGPETLADSLELCRAAVAAGTQTIVATPHVSWDWPGVTSQVVAEGVERVNDALRAEGIDLEVRTGAEIAMTRVGDLADEELVALRLGGGPYLLVECPYSPASAGFDGILHALVRARAPDRARPPRALPGVPARPRAASGLRRRRHADVDHRRVASPGASGATSSGSRGGCSTQGSSTTSPPTATAPALRRPPSIGPELEEAGFGESADWHARAVPLAILDGTPLPPAPPRRRRRRASAGCWAGSGELDDRDHDRRRARRPRSPPASRSRTATCRAR